VGLSETTMRDLTKHKLVIADFYHFLFVQRFGVGLCLLVVDTEWLSMLLWLCCWLACLLVFDLMFTALKVVKEGWNDLYQGDHGFGHIEHSAVSGDRLCHTLFYVFLFVQRSGVGCVLLLQAERIVVAGCVCWLSLCAWHMTLCLRC